MTCVWCGGYVPLAEPRGSNVYCTQCERKFWETDDLGFFDYSLEIYTPKDKPNANITDNKKDSQDDS
jgi:hypothetical protein